MIKVTKIMNYIISVEEQKIWTNKLFELLTAGIIKPIPKPPEWIAADGTIRPMPLNIHTDISPGIGDKFIQYWNSEEEFNIFSQNILEAIPATSVNTVLSIEEV